MVEFPDDFFLLARDKDGNSRVVKSEEIKKMQKCPQYEAIKEAVARAILNLENRKK